MPGLFPTNEPSSQEDDDVSEEDEAVPTQDTPVDATASNPKAVTDDDENPF